MQIPTQITILLSWVYKYKNKNKKNKQNKDTNLVSNRFIKQPDMNQLYPAGFKNI